MKKRMLRVSVTHVHDDDHSFSDQFSASAEAAAFASGSSASSHIAVLDPDTNGHAEAEMEDIDVEKMLEVNSAIAVEKRSQPMPLDHFSSLLGATFCPMSNSVSSSLSVYCHITMKVFASLLLSLYLKSCGFFIKNGKLVQ